MRIPLVAASLLVLPLILFAADPPATTFESTINLADRVNDSISVPANTKLTIHVINMAPANVDEHAYDMGREQYSTNPTAIETGPNTFKSAAQDAEQRVSGERLAMTLEAVEESHAATVASVVTLTRQLAVEHDEKRVPAELAALEAARVKLDPGNTTDSNAASDADEVIAKTSQDVMLDDVVLDGDQGLIFRIRRGPVGGLGSESWQRNFHVGGPGRFVSNYVFGFTLKRDDKYFAAPKPGEEGKFILAKEVRRDKVAYVPLVLFSWIPADKGNEAVVQGLAAGLGYDLSNLVVAGSYLWTWHRNIGCAVGVLAQQQQRLKGNYHAKDDVTSPLQSTDVTEPVWRPNAFVGISIRSVSALFH